MFRRRIATFTNNNKMNDCVTRIWETVIALDLKCTQMKQYVDSEVLKLKGKFKDMEAKNAERDAKYVEIDKRMALLRRELSKNKRPADIQGQSVRVKKPRN